MLVPAQPSHAAPRSSAATAVVVSELPVVVSELLSARSRPQAAARNLAASRVLAVQRRARVVAYARAQKGRSYRFGGSGPSGYDCSGLTQASFRRAGVALQHSSASQARRGTRVTARNARVGDLIAWPGHVAVLTGRWRMVDAPGRGRRVTERTVYRRPAPMFRRLIP